MRVRLVDTLSFWLLVAVGVIVLAMGAVTAWHLRQGFGAYLQAMLLALTTAGWLARQWARPLAAVQDATARIARGELSVRLPPGRSDEIGDVAHNVNLMAESLQRMEGARRRWIADRSHELRTPLTGLRGEIGALVDGVRPLTPAALLSLREDVLRLDALTDDLHLLAMADLHSLPCRFADADAVETVRAALQRFEAGAAAAGLSLVWAGPPPAARPVCWHSARIGQLLDNLLQNSLRYTDAPGRIALALQGSVDSLRLSIDDSAPGWRPATCHGCLSRSTGPTPPAAATAAAAAWVWRSAWPSRRGPRRPRPGAGLAAGRLAGAAGPAPDRQKGHRMAAHDGP